MYTNRLGEEYLMNKYVFWCYWSELKKKNLSKPIQSIYLLFIWVFLKIVPDSC